MQSYLFVGYHRPQIEIKLDKFIEQKSLKRVDYELATIDSVRDLNRFTSLNRQNTAVVISNIENASEEALNAFLKNLEEPQNGLYYLLTAKNTKNLLPTILSRCQIVRVQGSTASKNTHKYKKFDSSSSQEKLRFLVSIKDRADAQEFLEDLLLYYHDSLSSSENRLDWANNVEAAMGTLSNIKANGNVTLQLTNFVINLV